MLEKQKIEIPEFIDNLRPVSVKSMGDIKLVSGNGIADCRIAI